MVLKVRIMQFASELVSYAPTFDFDVLNILMITIPQVKLFDFLLLWHYLLHLTQQDKRYCMVDLTWYF